MLGLWIVVLMIAAPLAGKLTGVQKNDNSAWLPGDAEATKVSELQARFQSDDIAPAVIVYERAGGITAADTAKATQDAAALGRVAGVTGEVAGPLPADDGQALQTIVPIKVDADGWDKIVDVVDELQAPPPAPGAAGSASTSPGRPPTPRTAPRRSRASTAPCSTRRWRSWRSSC